MLFRRYALAAVDLQLLCDSSVAPWLGGNLAQSDPGVKQLQVSASPPSPGTGCTTPKADAGAPAPDASPAHDGGVVADSTPASQDSGLAPDGGATGQDGSSTNQTPTPDGQGGGGCRVGGSGSAPAALLPLIALLVLGRLRRSTAP